MKQYRMKNIINVCCLLCSLVFILSCGERTAKINRPIRYDKEGLTFQYPGNWKVTKDVQGERKRYLIIKTPGSAIFVINMFPKNDAPGIQEFAESFSRAVQSKTPVIRLGKSKYQKEKGSDGYEKLTETFSASILKMNLPHTRIYRRKVIEDKVFINITQVCDKDRPKVIKGFEKILTTLKYDAS